MRKKSAGLSVVVCLLLLTAGASAQNPGSKVNVIRPVAHDISAPLREMVASAPIFIPSGQEIVLEAPRPTPPLPGSEGPVKPDSVLQTRTLPLVNTIPGLNFDGVGANGYVPPDTNGSVGSTQYVQTTNVEFAVYDKNNGNVLLGPALIDTIWNGFSGGNCASGNGGDPVVVWDKAAQRWLVSQLNDTYNAWCMAVSTSADATGSYARYQFNFGSNLPDYPKLGVWPDAYYWSSNTFQNGQNFIGAQVCAFDRATMLSGGAANAQCIQESSSVASLLPSDLDGTTAPPAGEPDFFAELLSSTSLGLFKFHVDFNNPANTTFTGPTSISVASYSQAGSIPEPSGNQVDSLSDRLMFRLAYRNFGDHEALVVTHSVVAGSSVGARWYEIRSPNGTPTLFQQGTFAPDSTYRWMGSLAIDMAGDIALGYSASSSSVFPAVRYTGRTTSDPSGSMESEASIIEGTGSETGTTRWGDYSSMSVDPLDDCTFWYTTEYFTSNGSNWHTRIGSFKFANCGSTSPDFYLSANPPSQTVLQGGGTTYSVTVNPLNGYSNTVNLSLSGCPTGATCGLNPTSLSSPYTTPSTLTVNTSGTTPGGNYTITVQGTDGTLTHTTSVTLVVNVPAAPDFTITTSPTQTTVKAGGKATYTQTLTPLHGFTGSVTLSITGCPIKSTCTFSPNPATVTSPNATKSALTVATTSRTTPGSYKMTITATSGTLKHSPPVITLVVTKH